MIGLRELLRRWCDAAAPIEAPDHAPCAWADTAPPDRLALDREARRRELEHALAVEVAAYMIECCCLYSHTEADGRTWYSCDRDVRAEIGKELEYLTLCGLLDIIHGDVMLVRIRKEMKMCETCNNPDHEEFDIRAMWAAADKKEKDWRDAGEGVLLERMHDAWAGLKACGWREIEYCPKDGSRFLAISAGSTGVFPHYYRGEWPDGHWWCEAHGDLWPSRPILWKPMPSNVEGNRPPRESDG